MRGRHADLSHALISLSLTTGALESPANFDLPRRIKHGQSSTGLRGLNVISQRLTERLTPIRSDPW